MINKILLFLGWKKRSMYGDMYFDRIQALFDITIMLFVISTIMEMVSW